MTPGKHSKISRLLTGFTRNLPCQKLKMSWTARFDDQNFENEHNIPMNLLQEMEDKRGVFSEKEMNTTLGKFETRKAIGPDGICGKSP